MATKQAGCMGLSGRSDSPFPLTPALSPSAGEREKLPQVVGEAGASVSHAVGGAGASIRHSVGEAGASRKVERRAWPLPLPRRGGEGRGEGANNLRPTVEDIIDLSCWRTS